jgi:hypothetical protein
VTLLSTSNSQYAIGVQALGKMLRDTLQVRSDIDLVCLVAHNIKFVHHQTIEQVYGFKVKYVQDIANPDYLHLQRDWFASTYTKLHVS